MKVGILTFHFCRNFGAVLQCASLFKAVAKLGHTPEVIDYYPPLAHINFRTKILKKGYQSICRLICGASAETAFRRFREGFFSLSPYVGDIAKLGEQLNKYDAVIVGSDQVWNTKMPWFTPAYFLDPSLGFKGRKISYSACFGEPESPSDSEGRIADSLHGFTQISVRNQFSSDLVKKISGRTAEVVCDPALLSELDTSSSHRKIPEGKYILMCIYGKEIQGGHAEALKQIRAKYGNIPAVFVAQKSFRPGKRYDFADHVFWEAGPLEWMRLIKNATVVYTDSFHATMYALKFKTPFIAYYSRINNSWRLLDAARTFSFEPFVLSSLEDGREKGAFTSEYDFDVFEEAFIPLKQRSMSFLNKALSEP